MNNPNDRSPLKSLGAALVRELPGGRTFVAVVECEPIGDDCYPLGMNDAEKAQSEREIAAAEPLIAGQVDARARERIRARHRERHLHAMTGYAIAARTECGHTPPRPRASRRARRQSCVRRRRASRGDPEPGEPEAVVAAVRAMGGGSIIEVERAGFVVFHHWTHEQYNDALAVAIDAGLLIVGDDDWVFTWEGGA